ncbi:PREDICTED: RNA polymerase II degradation factor 1 [Nelumbo nucifera]|uniref:RNA polymerase II degradation factor 1 n=1 Tax=Nelumbo nucifera TaxID=4432 RepID=A0A1U7YRT1_NELNU|nr:PREDICTED: RNA polymerase II degradation factor 1 [Nelumbo nucifera]
MASGSSGRNGSSGKAFDFGSDDILCSYDDFGNQDASGGSRADPPMGGNPGKDFREGRMGRSTLLHVYNQQEESFNQEVIATVERTMKKYADNLLRFLEGISGRLQQLELYCYNLEKSVGEMRSDLERDNNEANSKLKSLEKHVQEVHRSVQILRDKQELAETQKELAKLQLAHKESSTNGHLQHKEDGGAPSASGPKKTDNVPVPEVQNQLALALPQQVAPSLSPPTRPVEPPQPMAPPSQAPPQNVHVQTQPNAYYSPQNQLPNPPPQTQSHTQDQYLPVDSQYQRPQMQEVPRQPQQPVQPQMSQAQQIPPFPSYQQQWPQQFPRQQPQQPSLQAEVRPQTTPVYPPYLPTQPANPSPEPFLGSMPMQVPFSGIPQPGVSRAESMVYGYNAAGRTTVQQQPPLQHNMQQQPQPQTSQSTFGAHLSSGTGAYPGAGAQPTQPQGQRSMIYDGEGGRAPHTLPPHYTQGSYTPGPVSLHNPQVPAGSSNIMPRPRSPSHMMRNHVYAELIEKAVSMGYVREHVASVIHRLEESGQPVDFNSVLDRLNVQPSVGYQRGWSG